MQTAQLFIDGQWCHGQEKAVILNDRYTQKPMAQIEQASLSQVEQAIKSARSAFDASPLLAYNRFEILSQSAALLRERRDQVLQDLIGETGYSIADATNEFERCLLTLQQCAEEAKRIYGECVPMEGAPGHDHRIGFTMRFPRGVVCAITPFNAPLNTVAHKIAPALAAGNAVILKPAEQTPVSANHLVQAIIDAGLPSGYLQLIHGEGERVGPALLDHPEIDFYGFTGSTAVGKLIKQRIGMRHCSLELGNISCTLLCADAQLQTAVPKVIASAFRKAGQVCTSIQKLLVEAPIFDEVISQLQAQLDHKPAGDPRDPNTFIGPMIDLANAERIEQWIQEAVKLGAQCIVGGKRDGSLMQPTVLINVPKAATIYQQEAFGPVLIVQPFQHMDEALAMVNDSPYGLTAGIFTQNIDVAMKAARQIRVGSVHINETSSARVDQMPSGGVKDSGSGREGPRYAIIEMMEEKLITMSPSSIGQ
jgi:succinate-semialdehyde dehydrogenase/glutarate-semialdehyde dehydrogenase